MQVVYLLLGSNEGDRTGWLQQAIEQVQTTCGTIEKKSAIYETAAWGLEDQPTFLNMALCVQTKLQPLELLQQTRKTEAALGRQRTVKWGQRTLDIDILFYGSEIINHPELTVPHPRLQDRRFALVPLQEIAPQLLHPVFNKTVTQLLEECEDKLPVDRYMAI